MRKAQSILFVTILPILLVLLTVVLNPPKAAAVPSYARQTGLACSGCHYTPPELNPAGRRFKLLGLCRSSGRDQGHKGGSEAKSAPRSIFWLRCRFPRCLETSFTSTKSPVPGNAEWQY